MQTDLAIAQAAQLRPITEIAAGLGLGDDDLELYGRYKAKIDLGLLDRLHDRPNAKYIVVTAITPVTTVTAVTALTAVTAVTQSRPFRHYVTKPHQPAALQSVRGDRTVV